MSDEVDYRIQVVEDRPSEGMWHTGPNNVWVTVTHIPTQISATAYGSRQHKVCERATLCVELMLDDRRDARLPQFPEVMDKVGG